MSEKKKLAKPAKPADVDERNLVEVGAEFAEATFEDKVFLWWVDNKGKAVWTIVGILVAVGGFKTFEVIRTNHEINLRIEAGQALDDPAKLAAFAKENAGTPQAAAALMIQAERQYQAREYSAALDSYRAAAAVYSEIKFNGLSLGRAELGAALAQVAVSPAEGEASLKGLAANQSVIATTRAEAYYKLAVLAVEKKDWPSARSHIDALDKLAAANVLAETWNQKAADLTDDMPPEPPKPAAPVITPAPAVEKK